MKARSKRDTGRDNPSYLRGLENPHWEMPLDAELAPPTTDAQPPPRLFDLDVDPAEKKDLAAEHPDVVTALAKKHDAWFREVMAEWRETRRRILVHDADYWKNRQLPDPKLLFRDHWQWKTAPVGTDPETADPLKVFGGYWTRP